MAIYELEQRIFYDAALPADAAAGEDAASPEADDSSESGNSPEDVKPDHSDGEDSQDSNPQDQDADPAVTEDEDGPIDVIAEEGDKINADDESAFDEFGDDVIINGDVAVVSSQNHNNGTGAVYIFVRQGDSWVLVQKLTASDGSAGDHFGTSIAMDGDTLVIGAAGDDDMGTDSGSVYVFTKEDGAFTEQTKIYAEVDGSAGDSFGWDVDIDNDTIVVGAYGDDDVGEDSGSAYVFKLEGDKWIEDSKIVAGDGSAGANFGWDVAIDGDDIVVGAVNDNNVGAAYIYNLSGSVWVEQTKLVAQDGDVGDMFGWDIDIDNGTIAIGAIGDDDQGTDAGAVYTYKRDGFQWNQDEKVTAADGSAGDMFGYDVSLDSDNMAVGATGRDGGRGAVYVFNHQGGTWDDYSVVTAENGNSGDHFGAAADLDGDIIIVGMPGDGEFGDDSGSAFILKHAEPKPPDPDPTEPTDPEESPVNDGTDFGDDNNGDPNFDDDDPSYYDPDGPDGRDDEDWNEDDGPIHDNSNGNDGVFDFGNTTPPSTSTELGGNEAGEVNFFDMQNMKTAFKLPNGEYEANIETGVGDDIFEQKAEDMFDDTVAQEGSETPDHFENIEHTFVKAEAEAVQNAQEIVSGFVDTGDNVEEPDGDAGESDGQHSNDDVDNAIEKLFLSDLLFSGQGDDGDELLPEKDAPTEGVHSEFIDNLDKSLDFLLK